MVFKNDMNSDDIKTFMAHVGQCWCQGSPVGIMRGGWNKTGALENLTYIYIYIHTHVYVYIIYYNIYIIYTLIYIYIYIAKPLRETPESQPMDPWSNQCPLPAGCCPFFRLKLPHPPSALIHGETAVGMPIWRVSSARSMRRASMENEEMWKWTLTIYIYTYIDIYGSAQIYW